MQYFKNIDYKIHPNFFERKSFISFNIGYRKLIIIEIKKISLSEWCTKSIFLVRF